MTTLKVPMATETLIQLNIMGWGDGWGLLNLQLLLNKFGW